VKGLVIALGSTPDGASNQPSITERLRLLGEEFEQRREALSVHVQERLSAIGEAVSAQTDKFAAELAELGDSITKLNVNQQLLAGSMDQWRSNDAGEIHLINTRIGAIQEDGTKRLQMLERLASDIEALAQSTTPASPEARKESARSFRQWLLGTEDWIKASWQKRSWF
jgi:anion-transporting  ArsA/GET3 family ATPase